MALPVIAAAAGLQALGSLLGGFGANAAGKQRRKAAYAAARQTRQEASVEASTIADQVERALARAAVLGAAAGGGFDGSAGDVMRDQEQRGKFNVRSAIWQGETRATALEQEGEVARAEGKNALVAGVIDAGSTLLGGMARQAEAGRQAGFRSQLRRIGG